MFAASSEGEHRWPMEEGDLRYACMNGPEQTAQTAASYPQTEENLKTWRKERFHSKSNEIFLIA